MFPADSRNVFPAVPVVVSLDNSQQGVTVSGDQVDDATGSLAGAHPSSTPC